MKKYFLFLVAFLIFSACHQEPKAKDEIEKTTLENRTLDPSPKALEVSCDQEAKIYPPSPFPSLLKKLSTSPYQYEVKSIDTIAQENTLLAKGIRQANNRLKYKKEATLAALSLEGLRGIKKAFVKGKVAITPNTYPRATIEEWEFQSPTCVEKILTYIKSIQQKTSWDIISKSPMDYWQMDNRLYFLVPGGFYMLEEAKALQKTLQDAE